MHMNRKIDARSSNAGMSAAFPNALESSIASASLEAGERSRRKRKESEGLERVGVKRKQMEKIGGSRSVVSEAETSRAAELRWSSSGFGSLLEMEESHISSGLSNSSIVATAPPPRLRTLKSLQEDGALKRGNFNRLMEMGRNMIDEMPCVSVRGCRRIEGFLYKYRRGEELRIVCVCHGNFFTPAEFVKHAGGGDVAQPLKHIVVNPSPSDYY